MSLDMSDPQQRVKMLLSMWLIEDLIWRQLARLLYYHTSWEKKKSETSFDDVGTELGKVMTFSELTKLFYLI